VFLGKARKKSTKIPVQQENTYHPLFYDTKKTLRESAQPPEGTKESVEKREKP